jgi:DNA repair photolyase
MRKRTPTIREALEFANKVVPKFKPVWDNCSPEEQTALARYFLPHGSRKPALDPTRPGVLKWYCPFAWQKHFPSGHRYCINVYTGCAHHCVYCYAAGYEPDVAGIKKAFEQLIDKDIADLERFNVPAAPVHVSNSTDPFQVLEGKFGHTKYALEQILEYRHRFTTVTILTKNPLFPVRHGYLDLMRAMVTLPTDHPRYTEFARENLPGLQVEVSLAFWQEEARVAYDLHAPPIAKRLKGIRGLHDAGIPLVLRIDPLFPRSPLPIQPSKPLRDFGLTEAQTLEDLEQLVLFAKDVESRHVVYSVAKIVQPRGRKLSQGMQAWRTVYQALSKPGKPVWRSGSWRLPHGVLHDHVVKPFLNICKSKAVPAKFCMQNLIETP